MNLKWDSQLVLDRFIEDKEKLLTESDDDDDDELISTPFCNHKFNTINWRKYLEKIFYSVEKNQTAISCPDPDCGAAIGPDTVEKLTIRDKLMYESSLLRSYLDDNESMIKQCPAQECNYFIEFLNDENCEEYSLNVVCLCGYIFCWRCLLESHRPITCNNASDWLSKVEITCLYRWEAAHIAMEEAKYDLRGFEETIIKKTSNMSKPDIADLIAGLMLIVQCRQVLKWNCVYDYLHMANEASKKEFLRLLQVLAADVLQSYSKSLKKEIERACFEKLNRVWVQTNHIGNYFYNFIKALQDGLVDVKVKSYDDFAGPYWLCDRCSYGKWKHLVPHLLNLL